MPVIVNPYIMKPAVSGPANVTFLGNKAGSGRVKSHTITAVPYGDADAARRIFILVHVTAGTAADGALLSATIAGLPARIDVSAVVFGASASGIFANGIHIISMDLPAGTSGPVTLTFAGNTEAYLGVFRVLSLSSSTLVDVATEMGSAGVASKSVGIDVQNEGVLLAGSGIHMLSSSSAAMSGISQSYNVLWQTNKRAIGGLFNVTATQANRTVTVARNSGVNTLLGTLAASSFR